MQNRYAGDIGDYIKLGLLRALSVGRNLGVAWYLYPDEGHNADGRHVDYLDDPDRWQWFDPDLFDALRSVVRTDRMVDCIERSSVVSARFHHAPVFRGRTDRITHEKFRISWFGNLVSTLSSCDLVFADPDNGLVDDSPVRLRNPKHGKQLPLREALVLARGRTAIIYHHNSRFKGGHDREVDYWLERLGDEAIAIRANAYSCRTFFIINPDDQIARRAAEFCTRWGQAKVRLHSRRDMI